MFILSFRDILLLLFKDKCNLMVSEIYQLSTKHDIKINKKNDMKVYYTILEKISNNEITSIYINQKEAKRFLNILKKHT